MGEDGVTMRRVRQPREHGNLSRRDDFSWLHTEGGKTEDAVAISFNEGFKESSSLGERVYAQYGR
jgi:hypothetical protein